MVDDGAGSYLSRPEGQYLDRKSGRIAPRDLAADLIAFANADGGTIVLGVENDGRITGMGRYAAKENQLIQASVDFCDPPIRVRHEHVACVNADGQSDHLLLLHVSPSDRLHIQTNDDVFLRVGDQSRKLTFEQRHELLYDKGETSFEVVTASEASFDDFDAGLLDQYRLMLGIRGAMDEVLVARGLARRRDQTFIVNQAGMLLFAKQPTHWLPRAQVRVLRYEGTTRETGPRMNIVKDLSIDGPLPRQLTEALRVVDAQLREPTQLVPAGVFRRLPDYPAFAWQEAITNAVVHRSYSLTGVGVEVHIFDDRLEVLSPGRPLSVYSR